MVSVEHPWILLLNIALLVGLGFAAGAIYGLHRGVKIGKDAGMKALDEYHQHVLQTIQKF